MSSPYNTRIILYGIVTNDDSCPVAMETLPCLDQFVFAIVNELVLFYNTRPFTGRAYRQYFMLITAVHDITSRTLPPRRRDKTIVDSTE